MAPVEPLTSQPLGISLPPCDAHAVSVSMPAWADVVGYEEADEATLRAMACGYPRFFRHPLVEELAAQIQESAFPGDDAAQWEVLPVPTAVVAQRLRKFLVESSHGSVKDEDVSAHVVQELAHVVRFPKTLASTACAFWQHSGEIVSSRQAQRLAHALSANCGPSAAFALRHTATHTALKKRIAELYLPADEATTDKVGLYPTGMSAIFACVRLLQKLRPGSEHKTILFGFPYVDTLKILQRPEWCAQGVHFFPTCGEKEMLEVEAIVAREKVVGIFTEFPGNPLLSMPDLKRLAQLAHDNGTVLVVDDTVGSYNVNTMLHGCADLVVTSLTKIFSGTGNVMGGSLVLNPKGPKYSDLKEHYDAEEDSFLAEDDAKVLLETSEDLQPRLAKVNATTALMIKRLQNHPMVKELYYPQLGDVETLYGPFLTKQEVSDVETGPCYGPLFSVLLHGGLEPAKRFYDSLTIAKGPSLGTNFTICCPYTILAHYHELPFVESCGVDRNLVRISVGQEDPELIWADLDKALTAASSCVPSAL